jgi:hypothetical protein
MPSMQRPTGRSSKNQSNNPNQDAEKGPQLRSRFVTILNVPLSGKELFRLLGGWAGGNATPPVMTLLRPRWMAFLSILGVGIK